MQYYFMINAKLPSLNEYINACRRNKYQAAKFKRDVEELVGWAIIEAKSKKMLQPTCKPVIVKIDFYEKTKKRDVDNIIAGGSKVILDTLVKHQIIKDDSRKYVKQVHCDVYDSNRDYAIVTLCEYSEKDIDNKSQQ